MIDKITEIMSGIKELEIEQLRLRNALEMMNRAYEAAYQKGYNDAMGWKTQNHLEHLPTNKEWVGLTSEELEFYTEELGQGELGRGVLRAVDDFLKEKNSGY
jgi:hypothetical protein